MTASTDVVHLIPCAADADDTVVATAIADAARLALADLGHDPDALVLLADAPHRTAARDQVAAWRSGLTSALADAGWRLEDPDVGDDTTGTPLPVPNADPDRTHDVRTTLAGVDRLLCLTRASLHARSGLEGVLHALAVGSASVQGLAALQAGVQPTVDREICGGCGMCVTLCGNEGIRHNGNVAVVRPENCLACGDCLAECYLEALQFPDGGTAELMDRLGAAAAAFTASLRQPSVYVAALVPEPTPRLTHDGSQVPQPRVGVVAGTDPVAVDAACADLAEEALGSPLQAICGTPADPRLLLKTAATQAAGTYSYSLTRPAR